MGTKVFCCILFRIPLWGVLIHRFGRLIDRRLLEIFRTIVTSKSGSAIRFLNVSGGTSSINSIVSVSSRFEIREADSLTN